MLVFLYGPDDYRRAEKKKEIIAEFGKKHSGLGIGIFDFEEPAAINDFSGFIRNQSIFEKAKLALILNAFELDASRLAKLLTAFAETKNMTVLLSEKDKPVKALAFLLDKPVFTQKFEHPEGADWMHFIMSEAKKAGVALDDAAARFLAIIYQGNSWALVTELAKLAALRASIKKADLDALDLEAAPNYWALLNGLKGHDIRNRLYALEVLYALNDPPAKIFNILAAQAGEKIPRMAEYDLAIKSGKMDYEEALLDLAVS